MINVENAMSEVLEYLKGIKQEDLEKISPKFMRFLEENASKDYKPEFDNTKSLDELELMDTSKAIISFICYKYWCNNENERISFYKLLQENEQFYEREWEERNKNMFISKEHRDNSNVERLVNSNLPIGKSNKIGMWSKIKNFIKNIITKKKRG